MSDPLRLKAKKTCGNCRMWETPESPYMGTCSQSTQDNPFMMGSRIKVLSVALTNRIPLQTSETFYCCLWRRWELRRREARP